MCSDGKFYTAKISLSFCNDEEFTCIDGHCVNMYERCDGTPHCQDESDEEDCNLVVPISGYNKFQVPPPLEGESSLKVKASYSINKVLYINEDENYVKFNYHIKKEWYNSYLTYQNLKRNSQNLIFNDEKEKIWKPWLESINMEDVEKCKQTDKEEKFQIVFNKSKPLSKSPYNVYQNSYLYKGSENLLVQEYAWTCEYICQFDYYWYPFDTQNCPIIISVTSGRYDIYGGKIEYVGKHDLGRYYFKSINNCDIDKYGSSGIFIDFTFKRPILGKIITMFLPTGMLLLISQLSTVFSKVFMDLVIEVNTTLLLVLTTL